MLNTFIRFAREPIVVIPGALILMLCGFLAVIATSLPSSEPVSEQIFDPVTVEMTSLHGLAPGMTEAEALAQLKAEGFVLNEDFGDGQARHEKIAAALPGKPVFAHAYEARRDNISLSFVALKSPLTHGEPFRLSHVIRSQNFEDAAHKPFADDIFGEVYIQAGVGAPSCWHDAKARRDATLIVDQDGHLMQRHDRKSLISCARQSEVYPDLYAEPRTMIKLTGTPTFGAWERLDRFEIAMTDVASAAWQRDFEHMLDRLVTPKLGAL